MRQLDSARRLRVAFTALQSSYPEAHEDTSEPGLPRTWRLVDAYEESKNPQYRGKLVLQEQRGAGKQFFIHWAFVVALADLKR